MNPSRIVDSSVIIEHSETGKITTIRQNTTKYTYTEKYVIYTLTN